ncbi:hypothetical protein MMC22_003283 [Lobaria immixta]|nr:hypothetical protein [Lobaria immixta]
MKPAQYDGYDKNSNESAGGLIGRSFDACCPAVVTKELVHKYQEYALGDPRSDGGRVVLDSSMLKEAEDVTTFRPRDLSYRFLSYVADASGSVKGTQRSLLLLVFGNGTERSYSITIGGGKRFDDCAILTRQTSREALLRGNPDANATLLTTSCYGGGWGQGTNLNITAIASVDEGDEMLSWRTSSSSRRACGSRYASGIARAPMKKEIEGVDIENEEGMEIFGSLTYAMLVSVTHDTLVKDVDTGAGQSISFSAKETFGAWSVEPALDFLS